jgi:hypothetical protein
LRFVVGEERVARVDNVDRIPQAFTPLNRAAPARHHRALFRRLAAYFGRSVPIRELSKRVMAIAYVLEQLTSHFLHYNCINNHKNGCGRSEKSLFFSEGQDRPTP